MYDEIPINQNAVDNYEVFKPSIAVVGVGGGGNNTIHRLCSMDIKNADLYAFNTDGKQLEMLNPRITRVILGREITRGLGAGGFPEIGEKAAELSRSSIEELMEGKNMVFLTAGMGGGTGTGAAPVIARAAKEAGAVVIGIVTLPFSLERSRLATARKGIGRLKENVDTLIVIDNQKLVNLYPNLPIEQTFKLADEITAKAVRGITETITEPSMMNMDFADIQSIMKIGGISMISVGSGTGHGRIEEAVNNTLNNKLLDVDYRNAKGVLLHITGGPDLTIGEANQIGSKLTETVLPNANVIWGARMDPEYEGRLEVIGIFTGVSESSARQFGEIPGSPSSGSGIDMI